MKTNVKVNNMVKVCIDNTWFEFTSCKEAIKELTGEKLSENESAAMLYDLAKAKQIYRFIMPSGKRFDVTTRTLTSYEVKEKASKSSNRFELLELKVEKLYELLSEKTAVAPKVTAPKVVAPKVVAPKVTAPKVKPQPSLEERLSALLADYGI